MNKFLVFSDLHLHNWNYGATYVGGWNSRLIKQANLLHSITAYCRSNNIQHVIFCGDLFHTHGRVDAACLDIASAFFRHLKDDDVQAYVLRGNHDTADKNNTVNSLRWLNGFDNVTLIDDHLEKYTTGFGPAAFISYTEDKENLTKLLKQTAAGSFVFLHQGVSGVSVGSDFVIPNEILEPSMIPDHVKHVFTGHYHSHKRINDKLTIIGSPMQHTWADSGEDRGWLVVDSDGVYERILSKAPEFVEVSSFEDDKNVYGNYIRVQYPVREHLKEPTRQSYLNKGALSVEFSFSYMANKVAKKEVQDFNLNTVIEQFQTDNKMDERSISIGQNLRNGTYETDIS